MLINVTTYDTKKYSLFTFKFTKITSLSIFLYITSVLSKMYKNEIIKYFHCQNNLENNYN